MNRENLTSARDRLRALRDVLAVDIAAEVVKSVLDLDHDGAQAWIKQSGDPIQDPNASLILVRERGARERPILIAAMKAQRPDTRLDPLNLAVATILELLDFLLEPSSSTPHAAH